MHGYVEPQTVVAARIRERIVDRLSLVNLPTPPSSTVRTFPSDGTETHIPDIIKNRDDLFLALRDIVVDRGNLIGRLLEMASERDQELVTLSEAVAERDHQLRRLGDVVAERDHQLTTLDDVVAERDRQLTTLGGVVADRDDQLTSLSDAVAARDTRIQELSGLAKERDELGRRCDQYGAALVQVQLALQAPRRLAAVPVLDPASYSSESIKGVFASILEMNRQLTSLDAVRLARDLLITHFVAEDDPNLPILLEIYERALSDGLPYWDIRAAARVASNVLRPATYLEVGTRRGWSLAQVVTESPSVHAYIFDLWAENYGDTVQGGPEYVLAKMRAVAAKAGAPILEFVTGNSHDLLPMFFAGHVALQSNTPPKEFDLVTVDGDHTLLGAWWDLLDLFPYVRIGGAILFDDLDYAGDEALGGRAESHFRRAPLPSPCQSLLDVWQHVQTQYPNFFFLNASRLRFQSGIAIRLW